MFHIEMWRFSLPVISLWLIVCCVTHSKTATTECQNGTCLDDNYLKCKGENLCGNTNETELYEYNTTIPTTLVPTKPPKKRHNRDEVRECPPIRLRGLENGKIKILHGHGQRIQYTCKRGYKLIGKPLVKCLNDGRWSSKVKPMCLPPPLSCEQPEEIPHGTIHGDQWRNGNRILYICDQGYLLVGSRERTCEDGYWSETTPFCQSESDQLNNVATLLKSQFIDNVGSHSSDSRGRSIGSDINLTGLELFILLDTSSSIDPVYFKDGIGFVKFLVDEFGVDNGANLNSAGTRIAVITFSDSANVAIRLDDGKIRSKQDAKNILDSIKPSGGGTAIQKALLAVTKFMISLRPKAKRAIFLLTDGRNNVGNIPPSDTAKNFKLGGMEIFTVGIGADVDKDELVSIASEPARNHVFLLKEYSDLSGIIWLIRDSPTKAPPLTPNKCGALPKITGKDIPEAIPGWPWLAVIYVKHPPKRKGTMSRMGVCSGSLICSQWILTSASCFYGEDETAKNSKYQKAYVTLGEEDLADKGKKETNFRISKVILHPKFRPWSGGDNDIALVKLAEAAPLELTYRPICLSTLEPLFSRYIDEQYEGRTAGWGNEPSVAYYDEYFSSAFNIFPRIVKMPYAEGFRCDRIKYKGDTNTFCAGSLVKWTCSGNLGSPLVVKNNVSNVHYVIGVLSNKKHCRSHYNMFTGVVQHIPWINEVTDDCQDLH